MTRCKNAFSVGGELYCCTKFDQNGSPIFCYKCDDFIVRPEPTNAELQELLGSIKAGKRLTDKEWELVAKALDELLESRGDS